MSTPPIMWEPTPDELENARLTGFLRWLSATKGLTFSGYRDLLAFSAEHTGDFWDAVREHFDVIGTGFDGPPLTDARMPAAAWYPNTRINYAENLLRHAQDPQLADTTAVLDVAEDGEEKATTWRELETAVGHVAARLRALGVRRGDRVGAVLPNIPEALVGLLAATTIGAVWTINSPDLSPTASLERLRQLEPKVLIGVDGYRFKGRDISTLAALDEIEAGLDTVEHTIVVRRSGTEDSWSGAGPRLDFTELAAGPATRPEYERVPFDHPLWILFSSGTTGAPKGIVHGHGGMTLEALKGCGLNLDMGPGDLYYVAANTSWMVWNTLANNLMTGASVVTYSGQPTYGRPDHQFQVLAQTKATMFGVGAAYLSLVEKSGADPSAEFDLSSLRSILSTGSPLPESTWRWVHSHVKQHVHLGSDTGGTDICSGFIGSNPLEPVYLGRLQGPQLGVAVETWDEDGSRVVGEMGELVVTRPMPSMPVALWGDASGDRYRDSYFSAFPDADPPVWAQGDWITQDERGGFVVHGRSDATLNRQGVRLGSADIYAALQHVPRVGDAVVLGLEEPDGGYWMPLFVRLNPGEELTEELVQEIKATIRSRTSARHVPDEVIEVPDIPVTHAGKRIEVPLKKLFTGVHEAEAVNRSSLQRPNAVDWFVDAARSYRERLAQA